MGINVSTTSAEDGEWTLFNITDSSQTTSEVYGSVMDIEEELFSSASDSDEYSDFTDDDAPDTPDTTAEAMVFVTNDPLVNVELMLDTSDAELPVTPKTNEVSMNEDEADAHSSADNAGDIIVMLLDLGASTSLIDKLLDALFNTLYVE